MARTLPHEYSATTLTLAGSSIPDAAELILEYFEAPGTFSTVDYFDRAARDGRFYHLTGESRDAITQSTIDAANWIGAQLTRSYTAGTPLSDWFHPQEISAPWHRIDSTRLFINADPSISGGEYDDMSSVWFHFFDGHPKGIGAVQVNKVLHQIFPGLFPLFDDRLQKKYKKLMPAEASRINEARKTADPHGLLPIPDRFFEWEPMRLDMIRESGNLATVRKQIEELPCSNHLEIDGLPINVWAARNLTDLRLIDILLWKRPSI